MARVKRGVTKRRAHKKILKANRGYQGPRSKLIRVAADAYWKAGQAAFGGRRKRKGQMRQKWIVRLGAAVRPFGLSYSQFIKKLSDKKILLNRKILSELAIREPDDFKTIVDFTK